MSALRLPIVPDPVTALRRAMYAHGFQPVAVRTKGKAPFFDEWQTLTGIPPLFGAALNTGINTRHVRAVDIDIDDPIAAESALNLALEIIGPSPLIRWRDNSVRQLIVYRGSAKKRIILTKFGKVELLGDGQQFVAFGVHDSGAEIQWRDADPANFPLADLPEAKPEAEERYAAALLAALGSPAVPAAPSAAPSRHRPPDARVRAYTEAAFAAELAKVRSAPQGERNQTLNNAALALGKFVAAGWLDLAEFNAELENAAEACGLTKSDGIRATRATIRSGLAAGRRTPATLPDDPTDHVSPEVVAAALQLAAKPTRKPSVAPMLGDGVDWTRPGGILAEMVDYVLATSRRPNRPLAVAASVAVISALCGRHLYAPTGTSMAVYIAALAETAVGKDRPFSAAAEFMQAAKVGHLHTTAKAFSVSAFEAILVDTPCVLATVDEMGTSLLARISNKNNNSHEATIKGFLQELWSRTKGKTAFLTTRRAQGGSVEIRSPNFTLFGASTPDAFYEAFTAGNVSDGFLNRFLIAPAATRAPKSENADITPIPQLIVDSLQGIMPGPIGGNLDASIGLYSRNSVIIEEKLAWADRGALLAADEFEERILQMMDNKPPGYQLYGRTFEYAVRLAGIHAVSRAGRRAVVTIDDLSWGAAWAMASARTMVEQAQHMMAGSDYEKNFNRIRSLIMKRGVISKNDLLREVRSISARDRDAILSHLIDAGMVATSPTADGSEPVVKPQGGRPSTFYIWL